MENKKNNRKLGMSIPPVVILTVITFLYTSFRDNVYVARALKVVRAALGMIIATIITLSMENYTAGVAIYLPTVAIGIIAGILLMAAKLNIPLTILVSAILGILFTK